MDRCLSRNKRNTAKDPHSESIDTRQVLSYRPRTLPKKKKQGCVKTNKTGVPSLHVPCRFVDAIRHLCHRGADASCCLLRSALLVSQKSCLSCEWICSVLRFSFCIPCDEFSPTEIPRATSGGYSAAAPVKPDTCCLSQILAGSGRL